MKGPKPKSGITQDFSKKAVFFMGKHRFNKNTQTRVMCDYVYYVILIYVTTILYCDSITYRYVDPLTDIKLIVQS